VFIRCTVAFARQVCEALQLAARYLISDDTICGEMAGRLQFSQHRVFRLRHAEADKQKQEGQCKGQSVPESPTPGGCSEKNLPGGSSKGSLNTAPAMFYEQVRQASMVMEAEPMSPLTPSMRWQTLNSPNCAIPELQRCPPSTDSTTSRDSRDSHESYNSDHSDVDAELIERLERLHSSRRAGVAASASPPESTSIGASKGSLSTAGAPVSLFSAFSARLSDAGVNADAGGIAGVDAGGRSPAVKGDTATGFKAAVKGKLAHKKSQDKQAQKFAKQTKRDARC
jgi:hypothetical protein